MTGENKRRNVADELKRAAAALEAAEVLRERKLLEDSVSRAYYHALHCARALLFSLGLEAKTHGGIAHLVNVHFVRTGRLDPVVANWLPHLETDRLTADYGAPVTYMAEMVDEIVDKARRYGQGVEAILRADGLL